jgi:N-acetylglucosaminyldiphosphoundecaprenol N-acetyl-beta-D-mannosaminyltransferase
MTATHTSLPNPPIAILGVPFDNLTTGETLDLISGMVESRRTHHLVTANVDFLVRSQEDIELRRILFDAHLVLCDGAPLLWASRLLGNPLPGGVSGPDIAPLLMQLAEDKGYRLFLLGGTPESTRRIIDGLRARHPKIVLAGHYSPPFRQLVEMTHDEVLRHVAAAKPDILFVALGSPNQEKWIAMHHRTLAVPVSIGVGVGFDFIIGPDRPAPAWRRGPWKDWFFRLWRKPRLSPARMAKDCYVFSTGIFKQWWQFKSRNRENWEHGVSAPVQSEINWQCIRLPESLDLMTVRDDTLLVEKLLADGRHCLLDAAGVQSIDSTGVGMLIGLQKKIRATGRHLVLLSPSQVLRDALALMHLGGFFDTAPDIPVARQLIEVRERERAAAVTRVAATPASPLLWQGEITAANAEAVWELTQAHLLKMGNHRELAIDLAGVRFIDSSGAGVMLRARKLARQRGMQLKFIGVQPPVLNVLRVARLDEFLLG